MGKAERELLVGQLNAAADRWQARRMIREAKTRASTAGDVIGANSKAQAKRHAEHQLRRTKAALKASGLSATQAGLARLPELAKKTPSVAPDRILEVLIETNNLLSVEFFERGLVASRAVGRLRLRDGGETSYRGTGFLIGDDLMLTNHHVLATAAVAEDCVLEMNAEANSFGLTRQQETFHLKPELFFSDRDLDVAVVKVAASSHDHDRPLASFGWIRLDPRLGKIAVNEVTGWVNIIQHPRGRLKEVAVRDNRLLDMRTADETGNEDFAPFLHYEADTDHGSSGAPVFNDSFELVALHHAGVPRKWEGAILKKNGEPWIEGQDSEDEIDYLGNEGLRVSVLCGWLKGHELGHVVDAKPPKINWRDVIGLPDEDQTV